MRAAQGMHRVAITGVGIVSCLGSSAEDVAGALYRGDSGVVIDEERVGLGFRSPLTGEVKGFDARDFLSRKQRKTMPDYAVQAYAAVRQALDESGLEDRDVQNDGTGIIFGSDSSSIAAIEQTDILKKEGATAAIGSGLVFRSMTSTITMNLSTILGTRGACWTISSACSSGGHAVGQAADLIALGRQERVICGGAQEINWQSMCSFDGLGAFSTRTGDPAAASRPFDRHRDGLVPSGGAAALVLERRELAEKRGAAILGEVAGYGFSSDGGHISVPDGKGLLRAMTGALKSAGHTPAEVDYLCAHATSTPAGDVAEASAILELFGEKTPPVASLKSMTGHELWMSGASQAVYSSIMARAGFMAPNINFDEGDGTTGRLNVISRAIDAPPRRVLCNAAGFGGTNSCLLLTFEG